MKTILDIVNASTGRNTATDDKFPRRIMHGKFDAGFTAKLQLKDIRLYLDNARAAGITDEIASVVVNVWEQMDADLPGSDITEMYPFTQKGRRRKPAVNRPVALQGDRIQAFAREEQTRRQQIGGPARQVRRSRGAMGRARPRRRLAPSHAGARAGPAARHQARVARLPHHFRPGDRRSSPALHRAHPAPLHAVGAGFQRAPRAGHRPRAQRRHRSRDHRHHHHAGGAGHLAGAGHQGFHGLPCPGTGGLALAPVLERGADRQRAPAAGQHTAAARRASSGQRVRAPHPRHRPADRPALHHGSVSRHGRAPHDISRSVCRCGSATTFRMR